jgi:CheY-like chemotaxis protein
MGNKRALVVDDSKVGRLTMKKKLEALGIEVDQVESGQEALDFLAGHRPDMIFMDHMMPGLDGFETTQRIKADPAVRDIPVIIISGSDDEEFVREARGAGALNAISKPPAPGVLEALLAGLPEVPPMPVVPAPVAEAAVEPAPAAPAPVAPAVEKAPGLDQAAVHDLIERALGEVVEHLHEDLLSTLDQRLATGLADGRQAMEGLITSLAERVEGQGTALAQLQTRSDDLSHTQEALGGQVQQALQAQEASAGADREAALRDLASQQDSLARTLQSTADGFQIRLDGLDQRLGQQESRLTVLEQGLAEAQGGTMDKALDEARMQAALEAELAPRLGTLKADLQEQMETTLGPALEETLRARVADMVRAQHDALRSELESRSETAPVAGLEMLQTRLETAESEWNSRFCSLEDKMEGQTPADLEARLEQALDQRIVQLRSELDGGVTISRPQDDSPLLSEPVSDLPDAMASQTQPMSAQAEQPLSVEVHRLTQRVKVLSMAIALGGVALAVAVALLILK